MKPYGDDVVSVRAQVRGYTTAYERFARALEGQDPVAAYIPLFEALNWAVSLDDRIKEIWVPEGNKLGWKWRAKAGHGAEILAGVRYARNSVHHHWADALRLEDAAGRSYPKRYPDRYFQWLWRNTADIPAPRPNGRQVYEQELAGRPAEESLATLANAFGFVTTLLEP